ncbi:unnamed protein product [Allacma fusca]|uniref:Uncharacterized protein n=1 Tax=Allacma fusca TaxID=39272 RepID=A0A8J2KPV0_9HEXA|nr:unnamed protein product [Allacma fusca]
MYPLDNCYPLRYVNKAENIIRIRRFDGSYQDVFLPITWDNLEDKLVNENCDYGPIMPPDYQDHYTYAQQHFYISRYISLSRYDGMHIMHCFINGWWLIGDGIAHAIARYAVKEEKRVIKMWDNSKVSGTNISAKRLMHNIKHHKILVPKRIILSIGCHDILKETFNKCCYNTKELIAFLLDQGVEDILILPNINSNMLPDHSLRGKFRKWLRTDLIEMDPQILKYATSLEEISDRADPFYKDGAGNYYSNPLIYAELAYRIVKFTQSLEEANQL